MIRLQSPQCPLRVGRRQCREGSGFLRRLPRGSPAQLLLREEMQHAPPVPPLADPGRIVRHPQ